MAKLFFRKKVLALKVEVTYGTDPTPTAAANAILAKDISIVPVDGEGLSRELDKATYGADLEDMVGLNTKITFKVEAAGSGVVGTAPAYSKALKACGYDETVAAGVSVIYSPIEDSIDSVTIYFYHHKKLHKITGSRGSLKFMAKKREYPYFEFSFIGIYNPVTATVLPAATLTAFVKPVPFRASTVSCSLLGQTVGLHEISVDFGQKANFYEHSEEESIQHEDRQGKATAAFELPEIGTHDFYADCAAGTAGALSYIHGTTAGNIVTIEAPAIQLKNPKDDDFQGVIGLRVDIPLTTDGSTYDARIKFT